MLAENGTDIGPALGESMGHIIEVNVHPLNDPEIGHIIGEPTGQTMEDIVLPEVNNGVLLIVPNTLFYQLTKISRGDTNLPKFYH